MTNSRHQIENMFRHRRYDHEKPTTPNSIRNFYKNRQRTLVRIYISFKMLVDKLKRGFPLKPPDSTETEFLFTGSGLEMVVFDII